MINQINIMPGFNSANLCTEGNLRLDAASVYFHFGG
jgi:hypothetical protein